MRIDQLTDWLLLLRPVSPSLISSLERVFLATDDFGGYQVASFVLANFLEGKEESERIVELIKRARPSQLPALLDTLRERGDDAAITLLKQEAQLSFANQDPALPTSNRRSPPDELLQPVLDAHGVVSTRFLMCQTLPISELAPVAESLREFGYRPIRIRPYQSRNQMLVAGIWTRDEHDWQLHVGITEAEVQELFSSSKTRQQFVTDLAAYHAQDGWKFILSFSSDPALSGDTRLAMAMPRTAWQSTFDTNADARFSPRTLQYATDPEGNVRLTQIWRRIGTRFMIEQRFSVTRERLRYGGTNYVPVDTAVHGDWNSKPFGAVWQTNPYLEVETLILESPSELAQRWIELYHQGFLPSVISVDGPSTREHPLSVSVWQRPMPTEDANRRFADIKSNILVALLSLGELDTVLPSLKTSSDPTLRSHIIHKTTKAHVPIRVLLSCLGDESLDAGTRQALILATGGYPRLSVPVKEREQILGLMNVLVCEDPDAGVHSAAEWLLRRWEGDLPAIPPHDPATVATRQWFVNSHGQTFAVLKFPDGFRTAGALSPPSGHHFALMTSEVTVRQFAAFRPDHRFSRDVAKEESCPANTMDWYAAAEFCNWLSQQEGLPESEWCYAPNEQGEYAVGMTIASDYLERRGYRLPLAAEWLYAASDATQSRYFFGSDPALLGDYAWFAKNAQGVLHPVAELLPSRFGFFDMYGNVKEWSQSMDKPTVDEYHVTNDAQRSVLGASFVHLEAHINANLGKHGNPPRLREDRNGFRVARTIFP
jgi:formylglycine-generating enzyme required for sulfatase activity